ncbi:excinuclease ABC subunit A [Candidatus Gastranaerophilus sp. (ex Termes propinquus)]|nr:excinuclease ABC subunit A [Candidatus Gastranaerophilus sp. (ex Termes propinquus)]
MGTNDKIIITGAREHNLKNVSLELPRGEFIVFTGVSGSGKSSLAFDTIFAEGQRRYVESLSTYARQFLGQMDKPDVEHIDGLSPAISIDQKSTANNPRSTVGTITEIYDYLRLLYARVGEPHCPKCRERISPQTIDEIVSKILELGDGAKISVLAPIVRGKKGEFQALIQELKSEGFVRVRVDGVVYNIDEDEIKLEKTQKHTVDVVVDRIVVKESAKSRIFESTQTALERSGGLVVVDIAGAESKVFSEKLACSFCNLSFEELSPRVFSFNSPYGACGVCHGLGAHYEIDPNLVVPDASKSLQQGAVYPWAKTGNPYYQDVLSSVCAHFEIDMETPFRSLSPAQKGIILYGDGDERIKMRYRDFGTKVYRTHYLPWTGVIPYLTKRYEGTDSDLIRGEIQKYMSSIPCKVCKGARLKEFPLSVTILGKNIFDFTQMSIERAYEFVSQMFLEFDEFKLTIAKQILDEIRARLKFMLDVGLEYLTLSRSAGTLSGGEAQRIRLATQIGSGLSGVLYVLDEPSIGLHQHNNDMLIKTLMRLRNLGNTLIVVEHDEDTIRQADYIVDIGPKAGVHGGEIVAAGKIEDIIAQEYSITGKYLSGEKKIPVPKELRLGNGHFLEIKNAHLNNLKNLDLNIPLGKIVAVTGVSGSGKSTLVQDVIYEYAIHKLYSNRPKPFGVDEIKGFENIDKIVAVDQSPIGRTPRSNPATYTDVFTYIRDIFSQTNEAKVRGYKPGRFSFNVKGGRCEKCSGDGVLKIEMNFLSDVYVKCDVCKGNRYNQETLEVRYKGKNISEVLDMTVGEALQFFENVPKIATRLQTLYDVGLDYIKLGQSATTLSGGEAQRVKLALELNKRQTGKTLYLLDEPSVGLHWFDIGKLVKILHKLADSGNTILIIEHNLDIIKCADHIIDLGPEGGDKGGEVVAKGAPLAILKSEKSYTAKYLAKVFEEGA